MTRALATAAAVIARLPRTLAIAGAVAACGGAGGEEPGNEAPTPAVEAVEARHGALPLRERLTGTVQAGGQVVIHPETSGPITAVLVQNGDSVRQGEPLVRIEPQGTGAQLAQARANVGVAQADVSQARANLEQLEARLERTETLAAERLVSRETLETHRAEVDAARAAYEQAQAQVTAARATTSERREVVGRTVVRAPISGRVGRRNAEVGMQVDPQTALFTIGRLEDVRVEVPVTQEMLRYIRQGQPVELTAESLGDTVIVAEVSRISPFLEEGSFSAEVEIEVPNPGGLLLPGMFLTVDVLYGESERASLVPTSALYEDPATGRRGVFEVIPSDSVPLRAPDSADGRAPLSDPLPARFRPVQVLAEGRQAVGVDGIDRGAWVVVVGQHLLSRTGEDGEPAVARVRPVAWDHVLELQRLQHQDLLRQFMEKQQELSREIGDTLS